MKRGMSLRIISDLHMDREEWGAPRGFHHGLLVTLEPTTCKIQNTVLSLIGERSEWVDLGLDRRPPRFS